MSKASKFWNSDESYLSRPSELSEAKRRAQHVNFDFDRNSFDHNSMNYGGRFTNQFDDLNNESDDDNEEKNRSGGSTKKGKKTRKQPSNPLRPSIWIVLPNGQRRRRPQPIMEQIRWEVAPKPIPMKYNPTGRPKNYLRGGILTKASEKYLRSLYRLNAPRYAMEKDSKGREMRKKHNQAPNLLWNGQFVKTIGGLRAHDIVRVKIGNNEYRYKSFARIKNAIDNDIVSNIAGFPSFGNPPKRRRRRQNK